MTRATQFVICTSVPAYVHPDVNEGIVQAIMARIIRKQLGHIEIKKHPTYRYAVMYRCPEHMVDAVQRLIEMHFAGDDAGIRKGWEKLSREAKRGKVIPLAPEFLNKTKAAV